MASNSYIKYMVGVLGIENVSINLVVFLFVSFSICKNLSVTNQVWK